MRFPRFALVLAAALYFIAPQRAAAVEFLHGAKRVLFLGDSITYGGYYVDRVETFLFTQYPNEKMLAMR